MKSKMYRSECETQLCIVSALDGGMPEDDPDLSKHVAYSTCSITCVDGVCLTPGDVQAATSPCPCANC